MVRLSEKKLKWAVYERTLTPSKIYKAIMNRASRNGSEIDRSQVVSMGTLRKALKGESIHPKTASIIVKAIDTDPDWAGWITETNPPQYS